MKMSKEILNRILGSITLFFLSMTYASSQEVEMADSFRAEGKIYIVLGVILILLVGLFLYLMRIERKVKKLENK